LLYFKDIHALSYRAPWRSADASGAPIHAIVPHQGRTPEIKLSMSANGCDLS